MTLPDRTVPPGNAAAEDPSAQLHSHAWSALAFLYLRSARNQFRKQLTRLRNPRYLAGLVIGLAYFYLLFIRNAGTNEGAFGSPTLGIKIADFAALALLITSARWWLFGKDRTALAFTPAEVHFLFPAPVTRRTLIHAKLIRSQGLILLNVLIWVIIFHSNDGGTSSWQRGVSLWFLFSALALHRLGATLVRVNALEHSKAGWRRSALPAIIFAALLGGVAFSIISHLDTIRSATARGVAPFLGAFGSALHDPLAQIALAPARALITPVLTAGSTGWGQAAFWALIVLALHYVWVVRLDAAFEEAAVEASQQRAERLQRFRSAQLGNLRSRKGKLARVPTLRLTGRPEVAIAWKNAAAAIRSSTWRTQVILFVGLLAVMAVALRFAAPSYRDTFLGMLVGIGFMFVLMGPVWNRYDLRLDLQNMALLKSYPLSGARIVAAEIAGVTLLHSITIWSLLTVPVVMALLDPGSLFAGDTNISLLLAAFIAVPVINVLMFTIQNGLVLAFPAWIRLGTESRGINSMGQNILSTSATILIAAVGLVFPVGIGGLAAWLGDNWIGSASLLVGALLAALIIALEVWPAIVWLGGLFERTQLHDLPSTQ